MITLSQAFRLCNIGNEGVYLQVISGAKRGEFYFWSGRVRELFDMKKVRVTRIEPRFDPYGPDFEGMLFTVNGITPEELQKLSRRAFMGKTYG